MLRWLAFARQPRVRASSGSVAGVRIAPASTETLAQPRALLRSQALPTLSPCVPVPVAVAPAETAQPAEQDPRQHQQGQRLPVANERAVEQRRHDVVPQHHHGPAEHPDEKHHGGRDRDPLGYPSHYPTYPTSHGSLLNETKVLTCSTI